MGKKVGKNHTLIERIADIRVKTYMNIDQINRNIAIVKWMLIVSTVVLACCWIAYILQ